MRIILNPTNTLEHERDLRRLLISEFSRRNCLFRNWQESEAVCSSHGGHLTSVLNEKDIAAIKALGDPEGCTNYWTGGRCSSGNCSWVDGSPFDHNNFRQTKSDSFAQCIFSSFEGGKPSTSDCNEERCFVCETRVAMSDCADWYEAGHREDGEYRIIVKGKPYTVYCDMHTAGGGWVVFQRRIDGSDSFWDHNWTEYRNGFGKMGLNSNFWLGNEALYQLTNKDSDVILRVEMRGDRTPKAKNPNGYWWNHYFKFRVGPEKTDYTLERLRLDWRHNEGNASTAWYDITYSVGAKFSTFDRINDPRPNCVTEYRMGGWWLRYCALATLNGAYELSQDPSREYGMFWILNGMNYIIHPRETTMMLKRKQ
nr:C-type lectin and Fibrinogen domain containing protein [Haemonchus contortus]